jgi:hypothetical protein
MNVPEPIGVVGGIKSFLVWVAGALAGITAILYACGYLVTRSHLAMLGLYGLVEFGTDFYLQEGAKFVITTAYTVLRWMLPMVVVLGLLFFAANAVWSLLAGRAAGAWLRRCEAKMAAMVLPAQRRRLAYLVFLAALLLHAGIAFDYFESPLKVVNLLYADPANPKLSSLDALILAGNRDALHGRFEGLLLGSLLTALLTLAAWRVLVQATNRGWRMLPFGVTLALYLVSLPMDYGVLERSVQYGVVSFAGDADVLPKGETVFLLDRKADGFVVWDRNNRRVLWLPSAKLQRAEIRAVEPLFSKGVGK